MRTDVDPLLACPPDSPTSRLADSFGIPTVPLKFRSLRHSGGRREALRSLPRGLQGALELRRVLRAHPKRALIYCTTIRSGMLAALAGLGLGRRVIWFIPDCMPPAPLNELIRVLARIGCRQAVGISRTTARDFAGSSRALASRTAVIYPGTRLEQNSELRPAESPRAAIVGHISPTKRTDLAIDIAERVLATRPNFELEVVGRAQYRDSDFALERRLKERVARDQRLRGQVNFVGYADDVVARLVRCSLLLHCRPDEPFGMALIEAMALGLPVVAPATAGPAEIVEDGVTGLLYTPGDESEAAAHITRLLDAPGERARMGAAARAAVESRFDEQRYLLRVDGLLADSSSGL